MEKYIIKKIELSREKLNKLIELHGTQSTKVLKCSRDLDKLIYSSYTKKGANS